MATQILASLGYNAQPVASGNDEVQRLLAELVADPKKAKLQYDTNSGEFMVPSRMPTSSAGVTMATRTSVPHFAELLEDQTVNELVRITPLMAYTEYGHLVALGPDGFFLCTCLRQLVDGLSCPHGLRAMQNKGASFNGACIAPRWRDSDKPWTMAALSAKPARLATAGEGVGGRLTPVGANPDVLSHSQTNVRGAVYANFLSLGKELPGLSTNVNSIAGCQRVLENIKTYANQGIAVEVRSQQNASTSRVFKAVLRPGPPDGGASGTGRGGRGGRGSRGRGGGRDRGWRRGGAEAGGEGRASTGRGEGRGEGRGVAEGGRGSAGPGVLVAGLSVLQPAADAGATRAGSMGLNTTPANSAHAFGASRMPLQSLSNAGIDAPCGGGEQASPFLEVQRRCEQSRCDPATYSVLHASATHLQPLPSTPQNVAILEQLQPVERQKHTGQSRRHTGKESGRARFGGRHPARGGARGAWGV